MRGMANGEGEVVGKATMFFSSSANPSSFAMVVAGDATTEAGDRELEEKKE